MKEKKILLDAWFSPDDKEELWRWLAESGLNEITIFPANVQEPEYFKKALEYCRKYGLKANVLMNGKVEFWEGKPWAELVKGYEDVVTGFDLYDEPVVDKEIAIASYGTANRTCMKEIVPLVDYVDKNFPKVRMFSTLFPNYGSNPIYGIPDDQTYSDYVKAFCDTVIPAMPKDKEIWLGTDFYPYYYDRFDGGLLQNLEVLQHYGKPLDANLFLYIQVMDSKNLRWRYPNRQEISLQYYIALAYGVKCIAMFCFQQPGVGHGFGWKDGKAMVTDGFSPCEDGSRIPYERTQSYYDVQSLNWEIDPFSTELANAKWQGVLTVKGSKSCERDDFSALKESLSDYSGIEKVAATENLIVGCFTNGNQDEYVLVNYSDPLDLADSEVEILFKGAKEAIVYKNGKKKTVSLIGGKYQTKLTGGEGEFVVPVK